MKRIRALLLCALLLAGALTLSSCDKDKTDGPAFCMGFGYAEIDVPTGSDDPLCIAGYHQGWEIGEVSDNQRASAVWIDTGCGDGILLISVDCIGLSSATCDDIRDALKDFTKRTGCRSINIFSTHDHAGVDTLGLWGDVAMNGKNADFMDNLIAAAVSAAEDAYASRRTGELYFGSVETTGMQRDSRTPEVYDPNLYQFRFAPQDGGAGVRVVLYAAHAESMRGDNTLVSRDYPGVLCDRVKAASGDDTLFLQGAIGGLIMTSVQTDGDFDAVENRDLTGQRLADCALSIDPAAETRLTPALKVTREDFCIPLDNTLFMYYRFLGILENPMKNGKSGTGYEMQTSLTVLSLGEKTLALLPGELFPELVTGDGLTPDDPEPLRAVAARHGVDDLLVAGLCNDEIGYVVPPSDYLLDEALPFIQEARDESGRGHYEETNSVGREAARCIAEALDRALEAHCWE